MTNKTFIKSVLEKNYDSASKLFEQNIADIAAKKLVEMKKALSAKMFVNEETERQQMHKRYPTAASKVRAGITEDDEGIMDHEKLKEDKPVWDKPNPVKDHKKLSPSDKAKAKARAARAGRKYPNMVDNIWAARNEQAGLGSATYGEDAKRSIKEQLEMNECMSGKCPCAMNEAKYQGREVPLNKPMKGDVKKSKVYVKDSSTGNVKKVNFGDKTLSIKKDQPARKRSYCARSSGQGNLTDKTKANYWSRRAWDC
jgi:hypothetical protein